MKGHKGLTLSELIMTLTILSSIALVASTMIFTSFNFIGKSSIDISIGNDLQKGYTLMKDNIKEASVICFNQANNFTDDSDVICNDPSSDERLNDNSTLYVMVERKPDTFEDFYYTFKDGKLIEENVTKDFSKVLIENVEGSFTYTTKNALNVSLIFKDEKGKEQLVLDDLFISLH